MYTPTALVQNFVHLYNVHKDYCDSYYTPGGLPGVSGRREFPLGTDTIIYFFTFYYAPEVVTSHICSYIIRGHLWRNANGHCVVVVPVLFV